MKLCGYCHKMPEEASGCFYSDARMLCRSDDARLENIKSEAVAALSDPLLRAFATKILELARMPRATAKSAATIKRLARRHAPTLKRLANR